MKTTTHKQHINDIGTLANRLKTEDKRNYLILRNFQWLMWVMIPAYLILFNLGPSNEISIYDRLGGLSFALSFLSFALIFKKYNKLYRSVDYGNPTFKVLTNAVQRYTITFSKIGLILIPVLLTDLGIVLLSISHTDSNLVYNISIRFQVIYFSMIVMSLFIGFMIWRIKQKPIRDSALSILKEMQS